MDPKMFFDIKGWLVSTGIETQPGPMPRITSPKGIVTLLAVLNQGLQGNHNVVRKYIWSQVGKTYLMEVGNATSQVG